MVSIALNALPTPHFVQPHDETVMLTSRETQLPFQHLPDSSINPRAFRVSWRNVSGASADAIRRHHDEHEDEVFQLTIPRSGEVVRVMWRSPPQIQWASKQFASSVTGELEEVLAYD